MEQIKLVEKLKLDIVDRWNDANPAERLNGDLQDSIEEYLHLAYVAGIDDLAEHILRILELNKTKSRNIPISLLRSAIINYKPVR